MIACAVLLVACNEDAPRTGGPSAAVQAMTAALAPTGHPPIGINDSNVGGAAVSAVVFSSLALGGQTLSEVRLEGTTFVARSGDRILRGQELVGATLSGTLTTGASVLLRIDGVSDAPVAGSVYFYAISAQGPKGWTPLCAPPNEAAPVVGVWDYREGVPGGGARIATADLGTFSCRTGAVSRCLEIGYQPWRATPAGAASAEAIFQSCVRMMRADYCGDGRSWTVQGVLVNVYDGLGWQVDTQRWRAEAEWTASGATCIARQRVLFSGVEPPPAPGRVHPPAAPAAIRRTSAAEAERS